MAKLRRRAIVVRWVVPNFQHEYETQQDAENALQAIKAQHASCWTATGRHYEQLTVQGREVTGEVPYTPDVDTITRWLAEYLTGVSLASVLESDGVVWPDGLCERVEVCMTRAVECGRNWSWTDAEKAIDKAYALLGASNPGTGYAWHTGQHPIQIYDKSK